MTADEIAATKARLKPGPKRRESRLRQATVILDKQETEALDQAAAAEGRSRSDVLREAARDWLKKHRRRT